MDAFDADVLIYAATDDPLGERVRMLFTATEAGDQPEEVEGEPEPVGVGSVILLPELLTKPTRDGAEDELAELVGLLGRLELYAADEIVAELAVELGAAYRLKAADAVHLATAIHAGADRFITDNQKDFPKSISEIDIVYPADL